MKNNNQHMRWGLLILVLLQHLSVFSKGKTDLQPLFNHDLKKALTCEVGIGGSASFVQGKMIKSFKDNYDVSSGDLTVKTKTPPLFFGTAGAYVVFRPFEDSLFSSFAVSLGLEYYKRGFTEKYTAEYHYASKDMMDKTIYREKYSLNMIGLPLSIRYGKRSYLEVGLMFNHLLKANKTSRILHTQSGADALDDGFSVRDKDKFSLRDAGIRSTSMNLRIGGGVALNSKLSLKANWMMISRNFSLQENFHNHIFQLQLNMKLNTDRLIQSFTQKQS